MRLAFALAARGGRSVRELLGGMDALEWLHWQEYDRISPLGDERGDGQTALIAAMLANQWRSKTDKPVELADLMPDHGGARAEMERRRLANRRYQAAQRRKILARWQQAGGGSGR